MYEISFDTYLQGDVSSTMIHDMEPYLSFFSLEDGYMVITHPCLPGEIKLNEHTTVCFYTSKPVQTCLRILEQFDLSTLSHQNFKTLLNTMVSDDPSTCIVEVGVIGLQKLLTEARLRGYEYSLLKREQG